MSQGNYQIESKDCNHNLPIQLIYCRPYVNTGSVVPFLMKSVRHRSDNCEVCNQQLSKSTIGICKNKLLQRHTFPEVVHELTCNFCNTKPIRGNRYFCLTCPNLNICEKCGDSKSHDHVLVLTSSELTLLTI